VAERAEKKNNYKLSYSPGGIANAAQRGIHACTGPLFVSGYHSFKTINLIYYAKFHNAEKNLKNSNFDLLY